MPLNLLLFADNSEQVKYLFDRIYRINMIVFRPAPDERPEVFIRCAEPLFTIHCRRSANCYGGLFVIRYSISDVPV